ncbi:helix-turn-helix domain-containing protein [Microbispora bryophytorum]|uniref:Helix-turn-helix domain-containing protein n=1 Tax=Microbispora bryophytorum subsp. camponoti TaxID=1677852 RepID=A0ABR8LD08_9ACTN|nr:helix-turn-helix domain-containing protein [Microbispora camponoti]MBD3146338.1 helix-turn-helix domain-containing protein [Microbispora camponoti]
MDVMEVLGHPVRLRVVQALAGGRVLTTSQLCERISDVHKATVYRHVRALADAGVVEVDGEHRVRGAVERRYRLRERVVIDADTVAAMSPEDHRRTFATAMAALISEFDAYLGLDGADPVTDEVGYRQHVLWLSREERAEMIEELRATIVARMRNEPAPHRRRHLLSPILFPVETPPPDAGA